MIKLRHTSTAILATALFIVCFDNNAFWQELSRRALHAEHPWAILAAFAIIVIGVLTIALTVVTPGRLIKPVLIATLMSSATIGFFMSAYGIPIDVSMIDNVLETDRRETAELLTIPLLGHVLLFGVVPSVFVALVRFSHDRWLAELLARLGLIGGSLVAIVLAVYLSYQDLAVFAPGSRHVRMLINPAYPVYALVQNLRQRHKADASEKRLAIAAERIPRSLDARPTLLILVLGETARADRFSLNGYERRTNRYTDALGVTSFRNVRSCGTSTAVSVPCIFSSLGRDDYSEAAAATRENLLELLQRLGVDVRWRENNTGCKGVCSQINTDDFESMDAVLCNENNGCYDEVLANALDRVVENRSEDHFIVLHQRGSHGPAYQSNTPEWSKEFLPECTTEQITECPVEQIDNAYDNTIVYTDLLLARTIDFLRGQAASFDVALLYVSDHGESLGEAGIYLHGFPYSIAPAEQTHVPMLFWANQGFYTSRGLSAGCINARVDDALSHDAVFHTVVGVFRVETAWYRPDLDLLRRCLTAPEPPGPYSARQQVELGGPVSITGDRT